MSIYLSLAVCIIGAIVYLLTANPKYQALALVSFGCGLLAWLLSFEKVLSVLSGKG